MDNFHFPREKQIAIQMATICDIDSEQKVCHFFIPQTDWFHLSTAVALSIIITIHHHPAGVS